MVIVRETNVYPGRCNDDDNNDVDRRVTAAKSYIHL